MPLFNPHMLLTKLYRTLTTLSILLLVYSCGQSDFNQDLLKPNAKNNLGDLLVVLDKKYWENSAISHAVKSNFGKLITTTPLPYEPEFKLEFVDQAGVNSIIKKHKTILIININSQEKNNSKIAPSPIYDLWARKQIVYKINATSQKNAVTILNHHADSLKLGINQFYYHSILASAGENKTANNVLRNNHGLTLQLPSNMKIKKMSADFTWLNRTKIKKDQNGDHEIQQGIFVYSLPYIDESIFSKEKQLFLRDSMLKKYVHGKVKNSYMVTRRDDLANCETKAQLINSTYVNAVRGLWRMENDKMGGPFLSISTLSKDQRRVVFIEGYVYAPNFKKRTLLKEMEAVLHSFKME